MKHLRLKVDPVVFDSINIIKEVNAKNRPNNDEVKNLLTVPVLEEILKKYFLSKKIYRDL